jgi:O-antigen/teichoic acid export membrane protein
MTRNFVYSTVSAGSAALMLLLLAFAGQRLGVAEYGAFTYAVNLATIAEVFMDFGLHQVTIRAIAREPRDAARMLQTSLWLKVLPGIGMVAAFGGAAFLLRSDPTVRLACLLMLVSATMRSYLLTARGILQGLEAFGHDALITTVDRALLLLVCGIALWHGATVIQLAVVFLVVRVVTAGLAVVMARRRTGPGVVDPELWRSLPAQAIPVGLFLLVLNLYNRIDTVMLGTMAGDRETGLYGAAYPVYEGLTYATAILSAVLMPRLSRLWHVDVAAYRALVFRSMAGAALLALLVGVAAWPLAGWGVQLVFGAAFLPASRALQLLLIGLPFVYVIWVLHAVAITAHQTRVLLWVTSLGVGLNVALNLVLIPRYASTGAAVATVISEIMAMCLLFVGLRPALSGEPPASH